LRLNQSCTINRQLFHPFISLDDLARSTNTQRNAFLIAASEHQSWLEELALACR
jgi:hypothetical protein